MDYIDLIRTLPEPTPAQYEEFAHHLCWAHSWYKHLPLLRGAEFVVLLAPDAGDGFPDEKPRMHYSWQTTREYRQRFGYLDYMYRIDLEHPFYLNDDNPISLPASLVERCSFTLYPFVSTDYNALEAISYDDHQEDLELIQQDPGHPNQEQILQWNRLYWEREDAGVDLTEDEWRIASDYDIEENYVLPEVLSPNLERYLQVNAAYNDVYHALQESELTKIRQALHQLHLWLAEQHPGP